MRSAGSSRHPEEPPSGTAVGLSGVETGYSAKAVANFFLDLARENDSRISALKVQELVYIAHGWHLAIHDRPLVVDEYPEAWLFGPVFPSLYHEFQEFGRDPIRKPATDIEFTGCCEIAGEETCFRTITPRIRNDDTEVQPLLRQIWDVYGDYCATELSNLTHAIGTPWHKVKLRVPPALRNAQIPNKEIREHYLRLCAG